MQQIEHILLTNIATGFMLNALCIVSCAIWIVLRSIDKKIVVVVQVAGAGCAGGRSEAGWFRKGPPAPKFAICSATNHPKKFRFEANQVK